MTDDPGTLDDTSGTDTDAADTTYADTSSAEPTWEVYDTDNDGIVDLEVWNFPDGSWQVLADTDGNLQADTLAIDVDGDGTADVQVQLTADGTYFVQWDTDLDGTYDVEQEFSRTDLEQVLPGAADLLDTQYTAGADTPSSESESSSSESQTTGVGYEGEGTETTETSSDEPTYESFDTDGDGTIDAEQWVFPDGSWQVLVDTDGDAQADLIAVDTNGDNEPDLYITANPDGTFTAEWDADFDGVFEATQDFTRAELDDTLPGVTDLLDTRYEEGTAPEAGAETGGAETGGAETGGETTEVGYGAETGTGAEAAGQGGAAEYGAYDDDGDGVIDFEQWVFPDGTWQVLVDTDFDLQPDQLAVDSNGDGEPDLVVSLNPDGSYTVQFDADLDGVFEVNQDFTRAELDQVLPGVADTFDTSYGEIEDAPLGGFGEGASADDDGGEGDGGAATPVGADVPAGSDVPVGSDVPAGTDVPAGSDVPVGSDVPTEPTSDPTADATPDYSATDTDGDGVVDLEQWIFPDGSWSVLADTDGDYQADTLGVDTDADGEIDLIITQTPDGTYQVQWDQDGDGEFEISEELTREQLDEILPGAANNLDVQYEGVAVTEPGTAAAPAAIVEAGAAAQPAAPEPAAEPVAEETYVETTYDVVDSDGDGYIDVEGWQFADGTWQILADSNTDGGADMLYIDTNGDDQADLQICENADGTYQVQLDQDGDGVFEVEQTLSRAELDNLLPGAGDLLDTNYTGTGA